MTDTKHTKPVIWKCLYLAKRETEIKQWLAVLKLEDENPRQVLPAVFSFALRSSASCHEPSITPLCSSRSRHDSGLLALCLCYHNFYVKVKVL